MHIVVCNVHQEQHLYKQERETTAQKLQDRKATALTHTAKE
jgi:hypothetical protein